jgi:hypothetical protein
MRWLLFVKIYHLNQKPKHVNYTVLLLAHMPGDDETQPEGNGQDQQTGETPDQQTLGINNVVYSSQQGIYILIRKYIVPQSYPTVRKC